MKMMKEQGVTCEELRDLEVGYKYDYFNHVPRGTLTAYGLQGRTNHGAAVISEASRGTSDTSESRRHSHGEQREQANKQTSVTGSFAVSAPSRPRAPSPSPLAAPLIILSPPPSLSQAIHHLLFFRGSLPPLPLHTLSFIHRPRSFPCPLFSWRAGEGRCHGHGEGGRQGPGEDRGRAQGDAEAGAALRQAGAVLQRRVRGAVPPVARGQREEGGEAPAGRPVLAGDHRSRSHHRRRVLRRAGRRHGVRRGARRREPARRDVSDQAGRLPQVPASEIVRALPGVHAGGGRGLDEPLRGPVRAPLRRKLFPVGVGFPQPAHGHAQDRRRLLPGPPPPRIRHRPAVPLLRHVEGREAVRGAGAGDGGGVLAGLRGLAGGRVLHGVSAHGVAALRAVGGGRADHGHGEGGRGGLRLLALRIQRVRQRAQAVVPLHHPRRGRPALRRAQLQPFPRRRVPALRALLLLRVASRALHHASRAAAAPPRHRPRASADAVRGQGGKQDAPSSSSSSADTAAAVPEDAAPVVPAVAVHVPEGRAGQPRGTRARVLPPLPALLPPALRRDLLPRQDAAPARRPHSHRRRQVQAQAPAAAAPARRGTPPPSPIPVPAAAPPEDLITLVLPPA